MLVNTHLSKNKIVLLVFLIGIPFIGYTQTWSLKQCIDTALAKNKTLKIAQSDIKIANEREKEATSGLIPKLYGSADYRYYNDLPYQLLPATVFNGPPGFYKEAQFGVPHNLNANINLELPLYNAQLNGAIHISKQAFEISKIQLRQTEEQIVFDISNLYYNAQIILNQIAFIKNSTSNSEKLLSITQTLNSQQLAKGTDVDKVKLQLNQLNTQLNKANSQYQQVINLLELQMGVDTSLTISVEPNYEASLLPETNIKARSTSEVILIDKKQNVIKSELKMLKLSHLPAFSLYGAYGSTGFGNYSGVNDFFKFYPVSFAGVKMSWLIFSGTTLEHKIFQKKEELKQNSMRLEFLKERQTVQEKNARMQLTVALANLNNIKSQVELAEIIYSKTLIQQKQGIASLTDVLLSDNSQKEAQQNYLSAMIDVMKADLELKKVTGNILGNNKQ